MKKSTIYGRPINNIEEVLAFEKPTKGQIKHVQLHLEKIAKKIFKYLKNKEK